MGVVSYYCCAPYNANNNEDEIILQNDESITGIINKKDNINNYDVIKTKINIAKDNEKKQNEKNDFNEESTKIFDFKDKNENENENEKDIHKEDTETIIYENKNEHSKEKKLKKL